MDIKNMTKEELENMPYDDLAFALLSENNKHMKIIDLFNEIGKLIDLPQNIIEENIGDFFEMLTLDKRFIMLDDGSWDLKNRHAQKVIIDDDDDDMNLEEIVEPEEENDEVEVIFYDEENDDDDDDDLKDLVVIDEEEESNF